MSNFFYRGLCTVSCILPPSTEVFLFVNPNPTGKVSTVAASPKDHGGDSQWVLSPSEFYSDTYTLSNNGITRYLNYEKGGKVTWNSNQRELVAWKVKRVDGGITLSPMRETTPFFLGITQETAYDPKNPSDPIAVVGLLGEDAPIGLRTWKQNPLEPTQVTTPSAI